MGNKPELKIKTTCNIRHGISNIILKKYSIKDIDKYDSKEWCSKESVDAREKWYEDQIKEIKKVFEK